MHLLRGTCTYVHTKEIMSHKGVYIQTNRLSLMFRGFDLRIARLHLLLTNAFSGRERPSKSEKKYVVLYRESTRGTPMTLADLVREGLPELRRNVHGECITPLAPRNPEPAEPVRTYGKDKDRQGTRFKRSQQKNTRCYPKQYT